MSRDTIATAAAKALDALQREGKADSADPWTFGLSVADAAGAAPALEQLRGPWLFVRRDDWVPPVVAGRFEGVIVAARSPRGIMNRDRAYYADVRGRGTKVVIWDWMMHPGNWRKGLRELADFAVSVGAVGLLLNIEPANRGDRHGPKDWRGRHDELAAYVEAARDLCDERGLELWVTGWALPSAAPDFPWLEMLRPAHRCIPQPYEVHGRSGPDYVAQVLEEWREKGAGRQEGSILLGRGAHELDDSDDDYWRTPAEIRVHRASTPPGMAEAWWPAGGPIPRAVLEAMLS